MSASGVRLNRAQRLALALDRNISLIAGAGTGKTEVLSRRFLAIVDKHRTQHWTAPEVGCPPGGLVAMTYTRKAAGEMRERIARDIGRHVQVARDAGDVDAYAYWVRMRRRLRDARITTIHGLCIEIVLDHALLLGIDPESTVLDEVDQTVLVDEAIDEALRDPPEAHRERLARLLVASPIGEVRKALTALVADRGFADEWAETMRTTDIERLLGDLRRATAPCTADEARVRLQAICGSIRPVVASPTRPRGEKAARFLTLCERLLAVDPVDDDAVLDAYCELLLRFQTGNGSVYAARSAHSVLGSQADWEPTGDKRRGIELFQTLREEILEDATGFVGLPGALDRELLHLMGALAAVRDDAERRYTAKKVRRRALDYADLEHLALRVLERRPGVLEDVRRRIRHLMVDEFQDTNATQWRIIRLLASDDPVETNDTPPWAEETDEPPEAALDDDEGFVSAASLFGLEDAAVASPDPGHHEAEAEGIPIVHDALDLSAELKDAPDAPGPSDAGEAVSLGDDRLFIVGDAKQSIYAFRGADVAVYQSSRDALKRANETNETPQRPLLCHEPIEPQHPDETLGEVRLDENFRSLPNLVRFANQLFDRVLAPTEGTAHAPYEAAPGPLRPKRDPRAAQERRADDDVDGTISLLAVPDDPTRYLATGRPDRGALARLDKKEAAYRRMAQHIADSLHGPTHRFVHDPRDKSVRPARPHDIAILLPSRTHLKILERALDAFGLPYVVTGGRGYWARPEVWDHVNLVAFLADGHRDVALAALLRSPFFAWTDDAVLALTLDDDGPLWKRLQRAATGESGWSPPEGFAGLPPAEVHRILDGARRAAGTTPTHRILARVHDETGYLAALSEDPRPEQAHANVLKFLRLVRDRETRQGIHLPRLMRDLSRRVDDEVDEAEAPIPDDTPGIRILTVHAAKGLEYPIVYLPDLDRRFPSDSLGDAKGYNRGRCGGVPLVTVRVRDADGETQAPVAHRLLAEDAKARGRAEQARLLYVAVTRACDHLVFVASTPHLLSDKPEKAQPPARRDATSFRDWIEEALGLDGATYLDAYEQSDHQRTARLGDAVYRLDCAPPSPLDTDGAPRPRVTPRDAAPRDGLVSAESPVLDGTAVMRDLPLPPLVLNPSAIETYRQCPARFRYAHIDALPDLHMRSVALASPDRGRLLGSAVHRVLEATAGDEPLPPSLAKRLQDLAREHGFEPDGFVHDVTQHVARARAALGGDGAVLKEFVFDHALAEGVRTRGVIDRLDHTDDGWVVQDTKSDRPGRDLEAHARDAGYDGQLGLYRAVIEGSAGAVHAARLVYTSTGETVDVAKDAGLETLQERLVDTRDAAPDDEETWERLWPRRPTAAGACRSCGFHGRYGGPCTGA